MNAIEQNGRTARIGARRLLAAVLAVLPFLAACNTDQLLKVADPSQIPADRLDEPSSAPLLVNGAVADFECAMGSFVLVEGLIGDEFGDAQLGAASWDYDRRTANQDPSGDYGWEGCTGNQRLGIYTPLSTARWSADHALTLLQGWTDAQVPQRDSLMATAALYAGFSYTLLGMAMCEASIDLSAPLSQQQLFALAEKRFDNAIDVGKTAGLTNLVTAAHLGRARVRLYQGNTDGADADAKLIPPGFVLYATASSTNNRRYNRVYAANVKYGYYTIEPQARGITTGGVVDPRTKVVDTGERGADGQIIWAQTKYTGLDSPIPIVRYAEARLIMAEAEGGQAAVDIINSLRDQYSLPHYTGSLDPDSIRALIISERRKEFFVEGLRLYDIQRFKLPLVPAPGTPFADKGGTYGTTTCLVLPNIERFNNPNAS